MDSSAFVLETASASREARNSTIFPSSVSIRVERAGRACSQSSFTVAPPPAGRLPKVISEMASST